MATRIYLPSTGTPPVSPAFDAGWDTTGEADRRRCVTTRISSSMTAKVITDGVADPGARLMHRQYVSDPINAQSISGTIKGQIRCLESSAGDDIQNVIVCVRVVSNDGNTVRGTLLSAGAYVAANEWATTATNRKIADGDTVSSVSAQANDRIVIELGCNGSATVDATLNLYFGDNNGTDLPEDETTAVANNPWIEFSANITFGFTEVCTSVFGAADIPQPSVKVGADSVFGAADIPQPSVKVGAASVFGDGFVGLIGSKTSLVSVIGAAVVLEVPPPLLRPDYDPTVITNIPVGVAVAAPVMVIRPTTPSTLGDQTRVTNESSGVINGPGSGDIFLFGTAFTGTSGSGGIAGVKLFAYVSTEDASPVGTYVPGTAPFFILKLSGGSRQTYGFVSGALPTGMGQANLPIWVGDLITSKPGGGAWTWADLGNLVEMGVTMHYTMGVGDFTELQLDEVYMEVHTAIGSNVEPVRIRGKCGNLRRMLRVTGDVGE